MVFSKFMNYSHLLEIAHMSKIRVYQKVSYSLIALRRYIKIGINSHASEYSV
jgi:hypothetical protein